MDEVTAGTTGSWYSATNLSTTSNWITTYYDTLYKLGGDVVIGGRGYPTPTGQFKGKVAAIAAMTLVPDTALPNAAEMEMFITDPVQWSNTYRIGTGLTIRNQSNNSIYSTGAVNVSNPDGFSTQLWLMGDLFRDFEPHITYGDSFSGGIHTHIWQGSSISSLFFFNMDSGDIENVTIPGLS